MDKEAERYVFDHQSLAKILLRNKNINEGFWGITVELAQLAATVPVQDGSLMPAAINIIQRIGIQRFPEANPFTVDAAEADQRPQPKKMNRATRKAKK